MEFAEVIQNRFSCRSFSKTKPVSLELIKRIIKLCQKAPSAGNLQAFRIIVVWNSEIKLQLAKAAFGQYFLADVPVVIVISAAPTISEWRYRDRGRNLYSIQDATIFASFIELACTNFGLGSVWVGAFSETQVVSILKSHVPPQYIEKPIALIGIGYCREEPSMFTSRISFNDLVYSLD
ncbi:MAG: nitroreductase family protein [Candidatus Hodarchaeota archaeon]